MSTELVYTEIKDKIIPRCYANLMLEAGEDNCHNIPSYSELINMLVRKLNYTIVWRWLKYLGYHYNEKKRSYYTNGHEREDVVFVSNIKEYIEDTDHCEVMIITPNHEVGNFKMVTSAFLLASSSVE